MGLTLKVNVSLTLSPHPGILFLLLGCLVYPHMRRFSLPYYVLFCYVWWLSLRVLLLSEEKQKVSGSQGEEKKVGELGGREVGESVQNALYKRKSSFK